MKAMKNMERYKTDHRGALVLSFMTFVLFMVDGFRFLASFATWREEEGFLAKAPRPRRRHRPEWG